jgi:hypothetical protein
MKRRAPSKLSDRNNVVRLNELATKIFGAADMSLYS